MTVSVVVVLVVAKPRTLKFNRQHDQSKSSSSCSSGYSAFGRGRERRRAQFSREPSCCVATPNGIRMYSPPWIRRGWRQPVAAAGVAQVAGVTCQRHGPPGNHPRPRVQPRRPLLSWGGQSLRGVKLCSDSCWQRCVLFAPLQESLRLTSSATQE